MSNDAVEVKLGADTDSAVSSMDNASSSISSSLKGISDGLNKFTTDHKRTSSDVEKQNREVELSFLRMHESIKSGFSASLNTLEEFKTHWGAIAGVLAGGALFREAIQAIGDEAAEVRQLQVVFGMASDEATRFNIALKLIGKSADDYSSIALRMGMQLKANEKGLNDLGIVSRDASGNLLPLQQIMQNAFTTMGTYKAGTDQAQYALKSFGRSAKEVYDYFKLTDPIMVRAAKLQQDLNIEMGPAKQAQIMAYKQELAATKVVMEEVSAKIGEALLPTLQNLSGWFNERGPATIHVFELAIKGIESVLEILGAGVATVAIFVAAKVENMATSAVASWQVMKAAATLNWGAIPGIVANANAKMEGNTKAAFESITAAGDKLRKQLAMIWADPKSPAAGPPPGMPSGNRTMPVAATATQEGAMSALEAELARMRGVYEAEKTAQGSFQDWSLEQTRDYWLAATQIQGLSEKDREAIEQRYWDAERRVRMAGFASYIADLEEQKQAAKFNSDERIRIAQQEYAAIVQKFGALSAQAKEAQRKITEEYQRAADQRARLADIEQKSALATSKFKIDMAKADADQQFAMGQISVQQKLALERGYLEQQQQLDTQALRDRIALMAQDPNSDPAKLAEIKAQLLGVEQAYQKQLTAIDNQAVLDRKQYALQAADAIRSSMTDLLASLTDRTKSLADKLKSFLDGLTQQLSKIASDQIIKQLFGAGTSGGNALSGLTDRIFGKGALGAAGGGEGAAATQASTALTTLSTTTSTATSTMSLLDSIAQVTQTTLQQLSAAAQQASTSLMSMGGGGTAGLPGMGGGFSDGSLFGGMGDFAGFPGFAVGTPYVPQDMLAVIHKGEAVIPEKYNRRGAGGSAISAPMTFLMNAPADTRSQEQLAAAAFRGIRRAQRSL